MVTAAVTLLLLPWMLCLHRACTLRKSGGCRLADGGKQAHSLSLANMYHCTCNVPACRVLSYGE